MATNTTTTATGTTRPSAAQAVAMVAGPALLLGGFATHPADGDNPEETLRTISEHGGEWAVSHLLLFAAAVVLIPAVLGLARVVGGRHRRIASMAAGLVVFASVGLAGAAVAEQLLGSPPPSTATAPPWCASPRRPRAHRPSSAWSCCHRWPSSWAS